MCISDANFWITESNQLVTHVRIGLFDAWVGPSHVFVKTPDGTIHRVENEGRSQLLDGDVIIGRGLGFGTADMLCQVKLRRDYQTTDIRDKVNDFFNTEIIKE
jgi:hypothetical protein